MSDITIAHLAKVVGVEPNDLLNKVKSAGIQANSINDTISPKDKKTLLDFLQGKTATDSSEKFTLTRKSTGKLSLNKDAKDKTVRVEVKKKRIYSPKPIQPKEPEPVQEQQQIHKVEVAEDTAVYQPPSTKVIKPKVTKIVPKEQVVVKEENKELKPEVQPVKPKKVSVKKPEVKIERKAPSISSGRTAVSVRSKINKLQKIHAFEKPVAPQIYEVEIPETISVFELAKKMATKGTEVIKVLMNLGNMATINQVLDQDTAAIVVEELGHKSKLITETDDAAANFDNNMHPKVARSPVVTIMGHVDHGKTSLLDYIRKSTIAKGESGGITQHIGAYHVKTKKGQITFLDTPGHAAFSAMRARGAKATDIVIIVVAADDGVKPQTIEAITHAKAAKIPILVAVNKIDKPDANPDKAIKELAIHDVMPESWGGDNIFVNISAKTGENIDELLDSIVLQAEVMELKAPVLGSGKGVIIESRLDKGRGALATVLMQEGSVKKGDIVVAGLQFGRIKSLLNEHGKPITTAGPSIPAEIVGLSGVCVAGDDLIVVDNDKSAKEIVYQRRQKAKDKLLSSQKKSIDDLFASKGDGKKSLNIVLKADVHGSAEAIKDALGKITSDEVNLEVVSFGVGGINESDVNLAKASNAILLGFNVRADSTAKKSIAKDKIQVYYYSIIYDLLGDINNIITGMLEPEFQEKIIGTADVRQVFKSPKLGLIAGCMVIEGIVKRNNPIRVLRENVVIFEGVLESLRRFKEDATEVRQNTECGIGVKNYNDVKVGDQIEVFERVEVKR